MTMALLRLFLMTTPALKRVHMSSVNRNMAIVSVIGHLRMIEARSRENIHCNESGIPAKKLQLGAYAAKEEKLHQDQVCSGTSKALVTCR